MKKTYDELKNWAKDNSTWFVELDDCFKFETKKYSFYVYPRNDGNTVDIRTFKKNGKFLETYGNVSATSRAKEYFSEMEMGLK